MSKKEILEKIKNIALKSDAKELISAIYCGDKQTHSDKNVSKRELF